MCNSTVFWMEFIQQLWPSSVDNGNYLKCKKIHCFCFWIAIILKICEEVQGELRRNGRWCNSRFKWCNYGRYFIITSSAGWYVIKGEAEGHLSGLPQNIHLISSSNWKFSLVSHYGHPSFCISVHICDMYRLCIFSSSPASTDVTSNWTKQLSDCNLVQILWGYLSRLAVLENSFTNQALLMDV